MARLVASVLVIAVALLGVTPAARADETPRALTLSARSAAAPAQGEGEGEGEGPQTIDAALEAGDLTSARQMATQQRQANPSAANWRTEAEVLESAGDYDGAAQAYQGELKALGENDEAARRTAEADLARVKAAARGTVSGEPASTHRKALDDRWAAPKPKKKKATKKKKVAPVAAVERDDRVVDKWYFWVTLGAIVASAAAVTAIAIRASRQEQPDALGQTRAPTRGPSGPMVLRF